MVQFFLIFLIVQFFQGGVVPVIKGLVRDCAMFIKEEGACVALGK